VTTSVLPAFLTGTLGASAAALGVIDGISDALIGVMKLIGGPLANDPHRRARTASAGYLGTAVATGAIGAAVTVWQVGALRAIAWLSRGLRSPARDALLASLCPTSAQGRAFGLERAGDNLGAVAGPLLAAGLVTWVGVRPALYLAAVPGLFAAIAIIVAARESRRTVHTRRESSPRRLELRALRDAGMLGALLPMLLFEFGNLATTLLILRATQLLSSQHRSVTTATSIAILIYAGHNVIATFASLVAGRWYDRAGPRVVFATGAAAYVIAYGAFSAGVHSVIAVVLAFVAAGVGIGLAEPTESAVVAQLLPDRLRGSGFGVLERCRRRVTWWRQSSRGSCTRCFHRPWRSATRLPGCLRRPSLRGRYAGQRMDNRGAVSRDRPIGVWSPLESVDLTSSRCITSGSVVSAR
jgi:MFS family permease